jgi:sirohydrochlorin cobaltochelatase
MNGIILFAHGARDPRWAEPFEALARKLRIRAADATVILAYLEHLSPDLETAFRTLAQAGITRARLVPLFFGRGGHLREDFPRLLARARAAAPGLEVEVTEAAGENDAVLDALAAFALRGDDGRDQAVMKSPPV